MIERVKLALLNCYGIQKLEHTFEFTPNNMPVAIYAPNGVMKTSLAKALQNFSEDKQQQDMIFPERASSLSILDQNDVKIQRNAVFVIDSINDKYQSGRISALLASDPLKKQYDEIFGIIAYKKNDLFKKLKKYSGVSKDIEISFSEAFGVKQADILTALGRLEREVKKGANSEFKSLSYKILFSPKVLEFLNDSDVEALIEEYTKTYEQILDGSLYFKKGVFNHSNAEVIAKNLTTNGWFESGHTVNLNHKDQHTEIKTEADLIAAIEIEKQKILKDPKLAEMFEKVDAALTTAELKSFRDYLLDNPFVVPELKDIDAFRQKVWISYLGELKSDYLDLVDEFDKSEEKIKEIIKLAEAEQTHWERVILIFNERFSVPFEVRVENKGDAVLNVAAPQLTFYFKDEVANEEKRTDRSVLDKVLSNGEKRALYILNIIFEVEARRQEKLETLFVVDDIADSFDYKNKYAIIEYLSEIKEDELFHLIILSHNYDFYRTVRGRLGIWGDNKLLSNRKNGEIELIKDVLSENPFADWKNKLDTPAFLIASISFVRNLAEYVGNTDAFNSLTSLLHVKEMTKTLSLSDLQSLYEDVLAPNSFKEFGNPHKTVFETMQEVCGAIVAGDVDQLGLEEKIALSIGIRLSAEELLIAKIDDAAFVAAMGKNQTGKLIKRYQKSDNPNADILRIMRRVTLMTPENIHLNSFMFEPILDLSSHHLKSLFCSIRDCGN